MCQIMKITRILAYRVDLPLARRQLQVVRRQVGLGLRQHGRARSRPTPASPATARSVRSGRSTCRPTPTACAPASPSWGRTCSAKTRCSSAKLNRRMDAALKGHPTSSRPSTWPAGTSWARRRASRSACCWAAATATTSASTGPSRRKRPRRWPASVAGYRAEGYRRFQLKVGGDPDVDIERIRAVAAQAAARRPPDRRRQHRLADARRPARRPGRARRRRLHRAAVPARYEECLTIRRHTRPSVRARRE